MQVVRPEHVLVDSLALPLPVPRQEHLIARDVLAIVVSFNAPGSDGEADVTSFMRYLDALHCRVLPPRARERRELAMHRIRSNVAHAKHAKLPWVLLLSGRAMRIGDELFVLPSGAEVHASPSQHRREWEEEVRPPPSY